MTPGPAAARVSALVGAIGLSLSTTAAPATEAVTATGRLSDGDFYRLVSCAAPPGGACAHAPLRWQAERPIRVALRRIDQAYLGRRKHRAEAALTRALGELNAAGARFRLARVGTSDPAEIVVYFLDLAAGDLIQGTGIDWVDGAEIAEIATRVAVDPARSRILGAAVIVATGLETAAYEAALLKAMTRAMGLTTEVAGPAYEGLSALAHDSYTATRLSLQDQAALRTHYAPES